MQLTACYSDDSGVEPVDGDATVTFILDASATVENRGAYADVSATSRLDYAVYEYDADADSYQYLYAKYDYTATNLSAEVSLTLPANHQYLVAFWLADADAPYTFDGQTGTVMVDYSNAVANDSRRDAFYARKTFSVASGDATYQVQLLSPFVQLNIGTNDLDIAMRDAKFYPTKTQVTVAAYDRFNIVTGEVTADAEFAPRTFRFAQRPQGEPFPVQPEIYDYLTMDYLLMGTDQELSSVALIVEDDYGTKVTCNFNQVPLHRNFQTNIYGQLLTSTTEFNIEVDPDFVGSL
jgi:hypothetical protein